MDGRQRILVVEGDDAVAAHLIELVEQIEPGARTVRASTVTAAIALADDAPRFDAAILSAELPDGPGLRVTQWALGTGDPPPSVLLASDESAELWEAAARSGVAVVLPREALTAERLRGGLNLARERALSERIGRLVTDAATGLDVQDRVDHELGALLTELLAATGARGARLSVGIPGAPSRRWTRGDADEPEAAVLSVARRTGAAVALLELFAAGQRSWSGLRPALTSLCEVINAALLRRDAVERVRTSESRLRDLAENVPDAIVSVDAGGRIAAANRRFSAAVGRDDAVGDALIDLVVPDGLAALAARAVDESRLTAQPISLQDHKVRLEGDGERWFGAKATRDQAGTVHVVLPDTTDRVTSERRLTELALTDHLTGLANRRLAIDRLQHALDQVGRAQTHLVVSLCDIDHFKSTNDLFGHAAGDAILMALADRLSQAIRTADTAARLGGDEFLIISEGLDSPKSAGVVIERLHDRLCGPVEVDGDELQLSVSLGYVVVAESGCSADEILRQADLALYSAKAAGRGRCAAYGVEAATASNDPLADHLEQSWQAGRFVLRWDPVAGLDGTTIGVRAMLWWIGPDGAEHNPDELVAALSNGPLFGRVRRWLIGEALRRRAQWATEGLIDDHFAVHVRVFPRQLADADLVDDLRAALTSTGTPPSGLALDVEDHSISSSPGSLNRLDDLASAGIKLYLDRFGAGAVPLERLVSGTISGVRVASSVLDDVWRDPRRAAMVDTLIAFAQGAGLDVIADGIDHPEQLGWLGSRPAVAVAGPLVSRPLDLDPMVARLAAAQDSPRRRSAG